MARKRKLSKSQRKAAQRKRNAQVRSAQVARGVSKQIDTINPTKISVGTLNKLSRPQLERLAQNVGNEVYDAKNSVEKYLRSKPYYHTPPVSVSKREREFAARKMPTDQQIAAAPPKKAKLLRQQKRKITAARNKLEEWKQYNAQVVAGRNAKEERADALNGTGGKQSRTRDAGKRSTSDIDRLDRYRNVLKNPQIVSKLTDDELRREIRARSRDLKSAENLLDKGVGRINERDNAYVEKRLKAGFGQSALESWRKLSRSERYSLVNQTSLLNRIEFYSVYNEETHNYEPWDHDRQDQVKRERRDIMAFLRNAKNISQATLE